ncbi:hypothetical protein B0H14DRAFT_2648042 [Mycena olivaceomarginata]|nr:hypothetical protein B0H14DRAFT_2648042 [Mycena olivaceomarginata]
MFLFYLKIGYLAFKILPWKTRYFETLSARLVRKVYGEQLRMRGAINPALESTKKVLAKDHRKQLNQPSRLGRRRLERIDEMEDWVVSASTLGSPGDSLETGKVQQQERYAVTEKAATRYEVCLLDIARPGKQRSCILAEYVRLARKKGKSMETPTISRVIDMEFTERWESESELWVDTEDWDWDGLSEDWEIPAGEYGAKWLAPAPNGLFRAGAWIWLASPAHARPNGLQAILLAWQAILPAWHQPNNQSGLCSQHIVWGP